ncbi:MAG: MTH938/NDUFAF3 family protein [Mariprofundaceae bacterium]|nr:MTH938/NDUFAF3 family protein [Mariprofundaceae bacterium]
MQYTAFSKDTLVFRGYEDDHFIINAERYTQNLLLIDNQVHQPWGQKSVAELTEQDFCFLDQQQPEILLIGTGDCTRFPSPAIMQLFDQRRIPFECMNSAAAARTFNLLLAEDRRVAAAMYLPGIKA